MLLMAQLIPKDLEECKCSSMAGYHRVVMLWTRRAGPELGRMAGTQTLQWLHGALRLRPLLWDFPSLAWVSTGAQRGDTQKLDRFKADRAISGECC